MVLNVLLGALVWGPSTCPSPEQVDGHLSQDVARQLIAQLSELPDGLHVELSDTAGRPLGLRILRLVPDCDARAEAVAAELRAWPTEPAAPVAPPSVPLRTPLKSRLAARPTPAQARTDSVELVGEVGAVMAPGPRAFVGRVWLVRAPSRGALTVAGALEVSGPGDARVQGAWQLSFVPAIGLRHGLGGVTVDAFIGAPMSVLTTTAPSFIWSGLVGARFSVGGERLAPFVQIAVAVPLVKSVPLDIPVASLSLTAGLRGGLW
jgi:hypothetical protein